MSEAPLTGILTFLFTDLEGSTRLWEQHPDLMQELSAQHDELLQAAFKANHGRIVKTTGDGFHVVFDSPADGIAAALAGQQAMASEVWPEETGTLKVRMGLHTGESRERGGDYYGPEVNRAARVMSIGHGGQILLSDGTARLLREGPPGEISLSDLGEYRLRGFTSPERVYQAVHPALPLDFPTLNATPRHTSNLPIQPNELIGRETEVREVADLLDREDVRLLTLTGPGGTGKTRLGLEVAEEIKLDYKDGVFFVPLAPVRDPNLIIFAIAKTWGLTETREKSLLESLHSHLQKGEYLLLMDNFEQVLGAAPIIVDLLSEAPRLKVIVTSREPLHVYGEYTYPVPPLRLPEADYSPSIESLRHYEAINLFVERAQAVVPQFKLNDENASAVVEICRRLDGLPLAIELAAARVRLLPPVAMLERLEHRLPLLTGGVRDVTQRQQTLRKSISWSHDLLNERERILFRRFSVFTTAGLEAVESICNSDGKLSGTFLNDLQSLIDKSLVKQTDQDGQARLQMLETIREYAFDRLEESGELERIHDEHVGFFSNLVDEGGKALLTSKQAVWMSRLERELPELRTAINWNLDDAERIVTGAKMINSLVQFWQLRGENEESAYWLDLALEKSADAPILIKASLLASRSFQAIQQGLYEQALQLSEQAARLYQEAGEEERIGLLFMNRAQIALALNNLDEAHSFAEQSLKIHRAAGDQFYTSGSLFSLGDVYYMQADIVQAEEMYAESLALLKDWGVGFTTARRNIRLGQVAIAQGQTNKASLHLREGLRLGILAQDLWGIAMAMASIACLAKARGQPEQAARLLGAAQAQLDDFNSRFWPLDQSEFDRAIVEVREMLGEVVFSAIWQEGRVMSNEDARSYALSLIRNQ